MRRFVWSTDHVNSSQERLSRPVDGTVSDGSDTLQASLTETDGTARDGLSRLNPYPYRIPVFVRYRRPAGRFPMDGLALFRVGDGLRAVVIHDG